MAYDIYGKRMRPGHCEVHPHIPEEYPCSECMATVRSEPWPSEPEPDWMLKGLYETCEYHECLCQSCEKDQGGSCAVDEGTCIEARDQNRCPVKRCPNYEARTDSE